MKMMGLDGRDGSVEERKKGIVVIAEYFPPRLGGDRRIWELVSRLSRNKYEFTFITLPPSYTLFISKMDKKPFHSFETSLGGIRAIAIGYPESLLRLWRKTFLVAFALTLAYVFPKALLAFVRVSPRLVIVNNTSVYTGLVGFLLSLVTRTKLFVDFNDLESEYTFEKVQDRVPRKFHGAVRLILSTIEDVILRRSNRAVTVHTQYLKRYAELRHKKRILYVPDGVDINKFTPSIASLAEVDTLRSELRLGNSGVCVYAGRIDWNIGGEILLETLGLLSKKESRIRCLILGEGEPDLIERMRKHSATVYVGLKLPDEVAKYIALADVVLVPYPRTRASNSVSPLKLFEALAMAKPVIASDVSGIRDIVENGHNGILVSDDPEQWVQAIERVIGDYQLRCTLAKNALASVARYDWNHLSRSFESAIAMALS